MAGEPAAVIACDLPLAYRLWLRITSGYTNSGAMPSFLSRLAIEWPIRLAALALGVLRGFRFPPRAIGGWWWIWRYRFEMLVGWYEFPTLLWIRRLLRPGMIAADIGAHIGYFTRHIGESVGIGGHVFAFEPSPENFPILAHNISVGQRGNVTCSQLAVTDRAGLVDLYIAPGHSNHSLVAGYTESQQTVQVSATTLDAFRRKPAEPLSLVKIDAEGAEPRILRGMVETIAANPDLVLVIEVNPRALECGGSSAVELLSAIRSIGLIPRLVNPAAQLVDPSGESFDGAPNLLCMRAHMWERLTNGG